MPVSHQVLEAIWNLPDQHVPAVHSESWEDVLPNNFRSSALSVEHPVPVDEYRPVPASLLSHEPLYQLIEAGDALLSACNIPELRYSLAGKRLVQAQGTTILLIERRRDGEIIACPWSFGESRKTVLKRLISLRRLSPPRLSPQEAYILANLLPRPAAALSIVGHLGIHTPGTNIMASGGECPIAVCIGSQDMHFCLDHRIYDPYEAGMLYQRFFAYLEHTQ